VDYQIDPVRNDPPGDGLGVQSDAVELSVSGLFLVGDR
jgi:hypothetical protein